MGEPYHEYRPPNGENYYDVIERLADFFRENLRDKMLIVSHGAASRSMIAYLCRIPIEGLFEIGLKNCGAAIIEGKRHEFKYKLLDPADKKAHAS
jgi:broad specificity phosphatase PhoE